jgi:hypothetical protein
MRKTKCQFCEDYQLSKELENRLIHHEYFAAMVVISKLDGHERGRITHRPRELVYCPTCGQRLLRTEETQDNKLKPCPNPKCKSDLITISVINDSLGDKKYRVYCCKCKASTRWSTTEAKAIAKWNKRTTEESNG